VSAVSESFRAIRTALLFGEFSEAKVILVSSAISGEGKSITASNLALSMAQCGHRTLLIDADFRRPVQNQIFAIAAEAGMAEVLAGQSRLRDTIQRSICGMAKLDLLPWGSATCSPPMLTTGNRLDQLLTALKAGYDRIIIDSPPVMSVSDTRALAAAADGAVLVIRMNKSERGLTLAALKTLREVGTRLAGVVVNGVAPADEMYQYLLGDSEIDITNGHPAGSLQEGNHRRQVADGDRHSRERSIASDERSRNASVLHSGSNGKDAAKAARKQ
jgi:capsular exopolysaccharide synthesis family protein